MIRFICLSLVVGTAMARPGAKGRFPVMGWNTYVGPIHQNVCALSPTLNDAHPPKKVAVLMVINQYHTHVRTI